MKTVDGPDSAYLQPSSDSSHDVRRPSPAIRGASHAFLKGVNASAASTNADGGSRGALAASPHIGTNRQNSILHIPKSTIGTPRESERRPVYKKSLSFQGSQTASSGYAEDIHREPSPSFMAAQIAMVRATPPADRRPTSASAAHQTSPLQRAQSLHVHDASVPPTKSLVQLYEAKGNSKSLNRGTKSVRYGASKGPPVVSPKPVRPLTSSHTSARSLSATSSQNAAPKQADISSRGIDTSHIGAVAAAAKLAGPVTETMTGTRRNVPVPPPPRRSQRTLGGAQDNITPIANSPPAVTREKKPKSALQSPQTTSPPRSIPRKPLLPKQQSDSTVPTVQAPKPRLSPTTNPSLEKPRSSPTSVPPLRPPQRTTQSSDTYIPQLTVNSLANAMVASSLASSLASSRAASPTKPPLPPPRRHHHAGSLFHRGNHSNTDISSRTPSPGKGGMRQTLREPLKSEEEGGGGGEYVKMKSGHLGVRKHPNKHHEGDRKRYRTQITESERKRYEGVWAANRGLLFPREAGPEAANAVLNLVVRDIWRRSRLSDEVLEEVWDLVDLRETDWLGREEFVVGMWLIDQRLKGNKLPLKVSESVWGSVRRLTGIKVPKSRQ